MAERVESRGEGREGEGRGVRGVKCMEKRTDVVLSTHLINFDCCLIGDVAIIVVVVVVDMRGGTSNNLII